MAFEFKAIRRVEFSETDMAGIVHYSNFFKYMETAEHGFFRALGHSVVMDKFDPPVGWPRVRAECDYRQPLRFEDEVEIHLLVSGKKSKSLSYVFQISEIERSRARGNRARRIDSGMRHKTRGRQIHRRQHPQRVCRSDTGRAR